MLADHLFQCRTSPWPKTAEKRGFSTGVTDGPTNGRTDRPSYRDAFLTDASKKGTFSIETESIFDYVLGRGIIVVMRPTVRLTGLSYRKDLDILK